MGGHKITWGKILVGAAVAAGAVAAFAFAAPYLQETVVPVIESLATKAGEIIANAWSWVGQNVIGGVDTAALGAADTAQAQVEAMKTLGMSPEIITEDAQKATDLATVAADNARGITGFIVNNKALSVATAAGAGALLAASTKSHHVPQMAMADQGFAIREQMRAADALMAARMAATGYGPAMGDGRGRG